MNVQIMWMAAWAVCAGSLLAAPVDNNSLYERMKAERAAKAAAADSAKADAAKPVKTEGWLTDFEQAKKEAAEQKQPMFVLFTGSDWCPWCVKLEGEALSTEVFKAFAATNMILFKADFTRKPPPEDLMRQNRALQEKFGIRGYPTVLLMDAEEKTFAKTGYREGGGEAYVEHLKALMAKAVDKDNGKDEAAVEKKDAKRKAGKKKNGKNKE